MEKKEEKYFYNPFKTRTIVCSSAIDDKLPTEFKRIIKC